LIDRKYQFKVDSEEMISLKKKN